jgi:acetyl-CoA carboxylase carboxyl transferase subunit beta
MGGLDVVVAAFHFSYMGGSMGAYVGEAIVRAAEQAVRDHAALIVIPASGGARMQEGMLSLMQMPRTIIAVDMVKEARLPYIVLLTDPTTGGVSASFAMVGDIHLAEPGAMIGFAGRRVIEETVREDLPENFQSAEYLLEHGMVDMVVERKRLKEVLVTLIGLLRQKPYDKYRNGKTVGPVDSRPGKERTNSRAKSQDHAAKMALTSAKAAQGAARAVARTAARSSHKKKRAAK